jgi:GT2 family glycosyltransferase
VDRPEVSAVTVAFDSGDALADCVRSVLAAPVALELAVVDNGSRDGSLDRLRARVPADPRWRILENGRNLGFAAANNRALREARGEFVLLVNPDCVVPAAVLPRVLSVLRAHPEAGLAGCLVLGTDGREQPGCRRAVPTPGRALVRALGLQRFVRRAGGDAGWDFVLTGRPLPPGPVDVDAISGAFMLARRAALDQVGLLDEGYFLHCEDLDWCVRFRQAGWRVLFVPDVSVVHAKGGSSKGRPVRVLFHMHRGMIRFYRKFFRRSYPAPLLWLVVLGVAARFSALATWTLVRRGLGHGR